MSQDRAAIADEREKRTNWIRRIHETHPLLSFVFLDLGIWLAAIGVVRLLPFVRVRWSTVGALLAAAIVAWIVLVFERPPRPGFGRR